ncbi:hypothetical protein EJ06DRAFT_504742 [Trichodelitschia bisporula]|uniref:Bicarbonate transporter-like transmembrane domain-containing protein n=1 Tax=Trichodelitschia bisporula TaxID=703511 RepID=A0A6G1I691_9PEZI|nr:hypothetical protein EJ06DRAFT_504742 [Trichodelitschia bisporula]
MPSSPRASASGVPRPSAAQRAGPTVHPNPTPSSLLQRHNTLGSRGTGASKRSRWWKIHPFRGMVKDVRRRAPFYVSDWVDAWDYRVVPATVYMYFANILPALAFSLDMFVKTDESFGVNEVLLASVLGAVIFALFAAQPLTIVGVTGPITVFNYTVFDIMAHRTNYFAFMCWIGLWSLVMHWILAITNACNGLRYVTRFPCDVFGFYVAFIYLQKGIQVLTRQWEAGSTSAYLSITVALLVTAVAYICGLIGESNLFQRHVRKFIEDYGTPLALIFFTGFVHIGKMRDVDLLTLPTTKAFLPTLDRSWFVRFWEIPVGDVFIAIPFAILLTILFYFDHNVSSLMAQGTEFPLRKPAGFHWDIFLLGLTTGVAGLLGIPFPNGLIPQAPFHTTALCVTLPLSPESSDDEEAHKGHPEKRAPDHVVEQRVSNLLQGLLTLGTMTGPLLKVLALVPQGVLAGLFFVMGIQALAGNGITLKLLFMARERSLTAASDALRSIRRRAVWGFVALALLGFGATFAITQTIAAIGFPVIVMALVPLRTWVLPRWFSAQELRVLDQPTAGAFVMESVGGNWGEEVEEAEPGVWAREGESVVEEADEVERGEVGARRRSFRVASGEIRREEEEEIEMERKKE